MLHLTDFIQKKITNPGVLAFQGDFAEHIEWLRKQGYDPKKVRNKEELDKVDYLSIPGGESTVIGKFLKSTGMDKEIILRQAQDDKFIIYGTCAGAILIAKEVISQTPINSLKLLDIKINRNAYGTQMNSFGTELKFINKDTKFNAGFIRAPKFENISHDVQILVTYDSYPVMIRQGNIYASTFHVEI